MIGVDIPAPKRIQLKYLSVFPNQILGPVRLGHPYVRKDTPHPYTRNGPPQSPLPDRSTNIITFPRTKQAIFCHGQNIRSIEIALHVPTLRNRVADTSVIICTQFFPRQT